MSAPGPLQPNDYMTFREAVRMFATKDELTSINTGVSTLASRVQDLVPREEHALHWKMDDDRFERLQNDLKDTRTSLESGLSSVSAKVDTINASRLPSWFLPTAAIVVPIIMTIIVLVVTHYWNVPRQ